MSATTTHSLLTTALSTAFTFATGQSTLTPSATSRTSATSIASTSTSSSGSTPSSNPFNAQTNRGISLSAFLAALATSIVVFAVQISLFLLLRNKLSRIFIPKTFLVPERERTESPPSHVLGLFKALLKFSDREIIKKCGLDAYFFLRYLKTLLVIFVPIAAVVIPILIPLNYVGGIGQGLETNDTDTDLTNDSVRGLDTLAWGNVAPKNSTRYWAHLILAICVVVWVCVVFFFELRVYVKVRQDYLTSAEHRLRASATTVLVNNVPTKWLTEEALNGLFDVFPGGIRNIWLTRDLAVLLDKIKQRDSVHHMLEGAETELISKAVRKRTKQQDADEKLRRKQLRLHSETKEEKQARMNAEDEEARQRAEEHGARALADSADVPQTVAEAVAEAEAAAESKQKDGEEADEVSKIRKGFNFLGDPVSKVGQGLKSGVGKAGLGIRGLGSAVDDAFAVGGFAAEPLAEESAQSSTRGAELRKMILAGSPPQNRPGTAGTIRTAGTAPTDPFGGESRSPSAADSHRQSGDRDGRAPGNTVRKLSNLEDMYLKHEVKFWQFWKPPAGGYASPVPQVAADEDPTQARTKKKKKKEKRPFWTVVKAHLPFIGGHDVDAIEYPPHRNADYKEEEEPQPEWEKWLKKSDRPTHRLPVLGFLPGLPLIGKKVDTIDWCREELARLNMEIEEDQKHPERYPLMNSAFIQFNHQVAAHMACQSVIHHLPKQMAPRQIEISPRDVIWDNMALKWWQEWLKTAAVFTTLFFMIIFWAIPIAWTAAFSQINNLIQQVSWLGWVDDSAALHKTAEAIAGVLPAVLLGLLLVVVPFLLEFLATFTGVKTGSEKQEFVQFFFFIFLFVQVFLVVSITSFFASSFDKLFHNITSVSSVQDVLNILAKNLPQAANYFFSYMVLQALSTSSGTLLQIGALIMWFVIGRIVDTTARNKWSRNVELQNIKWGSFFPVYTNFACIALVYCIVAPLIALFAIITFSLLWVAQRYAMIYITRFENDTGGVLYPRAINQTFTGLYVMELCLIGLFSIATNEQGESACARQAIIMGVVLGLTIVYQLLLNYSFSPLFRYLPITFEDEAVLRDEIFQKQQERVFDSIREDDEGKVEDEDGEDVEDGAKDDEHGRISQPHKSDQQLPQSADEQAAVEMEIMRKVRSRSQAAPSPTPTAATAGNNSISRNMNPVRMVGRAGHWAKRETQSTARKLAAPILGDSQESKAAKYRAQQRQLDLDRGEALYGRFHDEIEDLTADERDMLVRLAFKHYALRARRPIVWIPKDNMGISEDEIARTKRLSEYVCIDNDGTALDSKGRVIFGRPPPDYTEFDLINL